MFTRAHIQFIAWFSGIFFVVFSALYLLGLIPSELIGGQNSILDQEIIAEGDIPQIEAQTGVKREYHGEFPTRIKIPSIGVNALVLKPRSTEAAELDTQLTKGAVYYPGSGLLADGNVFIFGHSTNWKVVNNPAYKTFNGVQNLVSGDEIFVTGTDKTYVYKVSSVTLANNDEVWVDLSGDEKRLTLSTCNSFGKKQERYVVEAQYDREY
jgi:LPXTG-site transpeptidase (sortase) family protein